MSLNARLVVVGGDVKTSEIKLRLPSTIGRGKGTTIILQHPLVSRQHCELFESAGQLMVRDLGSLNGTFVNNQRVTEAPLPAGQLLTVGTVTFRAVYDAPATPAAPSKAALGATKVESKRPASAPTPKPAPPPKDSEELEFDFGTPLLPGDEEVEVRGGPTHPTEPLEADLDKKSKSTKETIRDPAAAKAVPSKPAPRAATKPDEATVDFSKWDDDEKDKLEDAADDDDDLNDFLKNLEQK
jgi:predicted component of type VI protein secretion system